MASEATGRVMEFLVLAFASGLGLWLLCQLRFTKADAETWDAGGVPSDGPHHHGSPADHTGDAGGHGGHASGDGGGHGGD